MTHVDPPPAGVPIAKRRDPFEPIQAPLSGKAGKIFLLLALTIACGVGAAYMGLVQHLPLTDMRVVAPAIGALWFGLRVFMNVTPKT